MEENTECPLYNPCSDTLRSITQDIREEPNQSVYTVLFYDCLQKCSSTNFILIHFKIFLFRQTRTLHVRLKKPCLHLSLCT